MKICDLKPVDRVEVNESSLNRIWQHVNREETQSWAILTSWRNENTPEENKADFRDLQAHLKRLDLGFIKLDGHGQEEDPATGDVKIVSEPSLFIPNIDLEDARLLMKKYEQYGMVYSGPEVSDRIMLITKDGDRTDIGSFHPHKIAQFYATIKGKSFVFEGIDTSQLS